MSRPTDDELQKNLKCPSILRLPVSDRLHDAMAEELLELRAIAPRCSICSKLATCQGAYEDESNWGFGCNSCCGHGNEDGHCEPVNLSQLVERLGYLSPQLDEVENELRLARADNEKLREAITGVVVDSLADVGDRWAARRHVAEAKLDRVRGLVDSKRGPIGRFALLDILDGDDQ